MKKLLITCYLFLGWVIVYGQSVNLEWAKVAGGTGYSDAGYSIAYDLSGNVYTTGVFEGTVDFDPGSSVYNLTSFGGEDIFISKFDSSGNFQWVKQLGGNFADAGLCIVTRPFGTINISGKFEGIADFDPGIGVYTLSSPSFSSFISELDSNGNFISAQKIASQQPYGSNSLAFDSLGNSYFAGVFSGTVDFDPGPGIYNLTSNIGNNDLFILKRDSNGNFIWVKKIGGTGNEFSANIVLDLSGNVYMTGIFQGLVDFDPGVATLNFTAFGGADGFICKLDPNGNLIWAKHIGGTEEENWNAIVLDQFNNVYTTGSFKGLVDFDPGIDTFNLISPSTSQHDLFISKLDSNGNFQWAKHIGGSGAFNDIGSSIAADYLGNIYTTGYFTFTVDFDPNAGIYNLSSGLEEVFILKLDPLGNFIWAKNIGGAGNDRGNSIKVDPHGNVFTTGTFFGTADFNPNFGILNYSSVGGSRDMFIHKMWQCSVSTNSISAADCSSYTLNSQTYTASGVYSQILPNTVGCDSIITLNLTINSTTNLMIQSSCNLYTLNGQSYTNSGIYTQLFTNSLGCDSILTLNLTINPSSSNTISQISCNSYVLNGQTYTASGIYTQTLLNSAGCDSILTFNLSINTASDSTINESACNFYTLNSQTYSSSGTFTQTLLNAAGCDSTLTLLLSITSLNNGATQTGTTLNSLATPATYQWVLCPTYSILNGATNQSYTAGFNGEYAVIVTQNGCIDTSNCINVTGVGVDDILDLNSIKISPNPTFGKMQIKSNSNFKNASVIIRTVTGEVVYQISYLFGNLFSCDISQYANGIYFIEITEKGKTLRQKILKE